MSQIVQDYWNGSAKIVREAGRAREIIEYWREASRPNGGEALFSDALHNAAAMLAQQVQTSEGVEELDAGLTDAFRNWIKDGSTAFEVAEYGWIILQRPRGRGFLGAALRFQAEKAHKETQRAVHWVSDRWERALESFGGKLPTRPTAQPVVRRTTLRDTLSLPASKRDLPEIYRLLFRLAPVEDQRFLVGREQELAGLEQALKDWEAGRFAACLVVGARGSGKTSLLNCATADIFTKRTVVRGQFGKRVLDNTQVDDFLRQLIGLPEDADIEAALAAERRILMVEESERTYLRKVGGFRAVNHLIHLIHRTAATTLWIIVMNDKASRVLDAGAQLSRVFSHRINAMSVSSDDLERAILERHRLSGLQLEFAPPPAGDVRVSRVKHWLGLQDSPQTLFFQSLFQQSEGVFRSAFELWLSSIERVEGETLKIRQPLDPAFQRFRNELAQQDHFTLLVIQEHGSLTQEELAEVLCESREISRSRMDRLMALGLIETDPEHPGLRVRPEAQRFANDLLRRVNLT
jgi:Mn-dependent DtxR family transcriptional regulator